MKSFNKMTEINMGGLRGGTVAGAVATGVGLVMGAAFGTSLAVIANKDKLGLNTPKY